eukprot:gene2889-1871_t
MQYPVSQPATNLSKSPIPRQHQTQNHLHHKPTQSWVYYINPPQNKILKASHHNRPTKPRQPMQNPTCRTPNQPTQTFTHKPNTHPTRQQKPDRPQLTTKQENPANRQTTEPKWYALLCRDLNIYTNTSTQSNTKTLPDQLHSIDSPCQLQPFSRVAKSLITTQPPKPHNDMAQPPKLNHTYGCKICKLQTTRSHMPQSKPVA